MSALFYHTIEARYRAGRGRGDFAEWVAGRSASPTSPTGSPTSTRTRAASSASATAISTSCPTPSRTEPPDGPGLARSSSTTTGRSPPAARWTSSCASASACAGRRFVHVSASRYGGAGLEVLNRLVPIMNDLGVETTWEITIGTADFDQVGPRGEPGPRGHRAGHHRGHARPTARDRGRERAPAPARRRSRDGARRRPDRPRRAARRRRALGVAVPPGSLVRPAADLERAAPDRPALRRRRLLPRPLRDAALHSALRRLPVHRSALRAQSRDDPRPSRPPSWTASGSRATSRSCSRWGRSSVSTTRSG